MQQLQTSGSVMTCAGMVSLTPSSPPFVQCVCLKVISLAYNHHIINILLSTRGVGVTSCCHAASLGSVFVCVGAGGGRREVHVVSVCVHVCEVVCVIND